MIYNVYVPKKIVLPDKFSQATWDEIVYACQKNKVPETWVVGNSTNMIYWGDEEYQVDIIGKAHDDYADGSGKAPLTFMLHNLYGELWKMNEEATNVGGWESCYMRTNRMPELLSHFTAPAKDAVREVNKLTSAGNKSSVIVTTADKLFLLSEIEIFGSVSYSKSGEGTQYDYYKAGNSRVKKYGSSTYTWWERSPIGNGNTIFCYVNSDGNADFGNASYQFGVAFAFCL